MTTRFRYQAIAADGRRHRGEIEALSSASLSASLAGQGLVLLDATEARAESKPAGRATRFGSRAAVLEATRALAALLPAGLPLPRAITGAASVTKPPVSTALEQIRDAVEHGSTLASALAAHPALFPPAYIGVIRAGERSGDISAAFTRLADHLERQERLRARLLSAALYPVLLGLAGGIAITVLLLFVLPRFAELLQDSGASLPASTASLLAASAALREHWALTIFVPLGLTLLAVAWVTGTAEGKRFWSRAVLSIPVLSHFRRHVLSARFARLLGALVGGGAPLLAALEDTEASLADPVASEAVGRIRASVREGVPLRSAIAADGPWAPLLSQLVAVGEESGRLEEFLLKAATILEERTERLAQRLVSLVEPVMIVLFGGIVGFVALSLLQAIYSVNATSFR